LKNYKQVYLIAKDLGFDYQSIADVPEFNNEKEALTYWKNNNRKIKDSNFFNDPLVIVRREVHTVLAKRLD
tara:strand:- start:553 stop:765 length:213 start_codon:yes stop_codon:yes gene_type:complete